VSYPRRCASATFNFKVDKQVKVFIHLSFCENPVCRDDFLKEISEFVGVYRCFIDCKKCCTHLIDWRQHNPKTDKAKIKKYFFMSLIKISGCKDRFLEEVTVLDVLGQTANVFYLPHWGTSILSMIDWPIVCPVRLCVYPERGCPYRVQENWLMSNGRSVIDDFKNE